MQLNGGPGDERRMKAIREGTIDAIFDEGLVLWFERGARLGDAAGDARRLDVQVFGRDLGWRKYTIKPGRFKGLRENYTCIDYSGWPIYTRAAPTRRRRL